MFESFITSPYLWVSLTVGFYLLAAKLQKKWPIPIFNPLLFSIVAIILLLSVTRIPYGIYQTGGQLIATFVTPATVALALNLRRILFI